MLYFKTEEENTNWLQYLLEEFCRIEQAAFDFRIIPGSHEAEGSCLTVDEKYQHAFETLSRKKEYQAALAGHAVQSYTFRHPDKKMDWTVPGVNQFFKTLKKTIQSRFPELHFRPEQKAMLELSHDLDYVEKTMPLRLKQSAFHLFNAVTKARPQKLEQAFRFLLGRTNYWCFDYWMDFENSMHFTSVFYVYQKANKGGMKQWLLDPAYDISVHPKLREQLKEMIRKGWEVGLHGSFFSAGDEALLSREKELLETNLDHPITKGRQHWLRYDEQITPFIHEKLFEQDSTIGWNDRIGFRAGIASKYRPYNLPEDRPFDYFVVPQVIMDAHIYDYGYGREDLLLQQGMTMLDTCRSLGNTHVSISWHPRTCSKDYNWHKGYEKLLSSW